MPVIGISARPTTPYAAGSREKRVLRTAFVVSLLLHLVGAAATWRLPLAPKIDPREARRAADEVELVLVPDEEAAAAASDDPTAFTSIPDRHASAAPPEDPDYLAMHHSLAADTKLGDAQTPSAEEAWEAEMVEIRREELEGAGGVSYAPQPEPVDRPSAGDQAVRQEERRAGTDPSQERGRSGELALPRPETERGDDGAESQDGASGARKPELEDWWTGGSPSILKDGEQGAVGDRGFDFNQVPRGQITSGVAVVDGFHLNTVAWRWAPWMQAFANELHRHWQAPYAYRLGVIDGKTVIRLVVEKDGRPSSLDVIETDGHQSLHDASRAALTAFAPYAPLPPGFPEENLVITLSLHYPAWRR